MKKKRCRHCKKLFSPDARNATRQKYCCKNSECRKASKKDSQKRWLEKPENQDYFRGSQNSARVIEWRENHPDYRRRKSSKKTCALQETLTPKPTENTSDTAKLELGVLQDVITAQPIVLLGLIANITGVALQDDMAVTIRRLLQLGLDFTNQASTSKGECHDFKTTCLPTASSNGTQTVQLAGSPSGP